MMTPTRRAVALTAAGAPIALFVAVWAPNLWIVGLAWVMAVVSLVGLDAWLAPSPRSARLTLRAPAEIAAVAAPAQAALEVAFPRRAPASVDAALETNEKILATPARVRARTQDGVATAIFSLAPARRGQGVTSRVWARWTGPLGLVALHASEATGAITTVIPNIAEVRRGALTLFARDAVFGEKSQLDPGDGAEFHALMEFQQGMDMRAIDWKQSARHRRLLAKEFRSERNHPIMLAIDAGRVMCEPIEGAPRLDRALNAALLLAYVSLKVGDRVGLAAFDSRPRLLAKTAAGAAAFPVLQRLAARIDYSVEETNFTFGLTTVASALDRRALVVIFTEFADMTSAQLLLETASRMARRHLLLFVLFTDAELEAVVRRTPETSADVTRAVVADNLLTERALVVARIRRLGAEVVEAPAARMGPALIDRYLSLKRANRL